MDTKVTTDPRKVADFSLAGGGLFAGTLKRLGLADRLPARVLAIVLVAWLPLLVLSFLEGLAVGNSVRIPFLKDYGVYGRLLIGLPALILAEVPIGVRTRDVLREFITSKIISDRDLPKYNDAVSDATRRKDKMLPEILILAAIYVLTILRARVVLSDPVTTWYNTADGTTYAALYYAFVSLPIFQFLLLRWVWRTAIWAILLWRIARLDLQLLPIHPDKMGGLGFLGLAQIPFGLIGFAGGAIISSYLANMMVYESASLSDSIVPMAAYVLLATLATLAPVLAFSGRLVRLRASGILSYSDVGAEYAGAFDRKWARGNNPESEPILGTADIQSLADLRNSFEIIQGMSLIAADRITLAVLAASAAIPMVPLFFLALPVEEIIAGVLGIPLK